MLTSAGFPPDSVRNLNMNTLVDGLFHASTWLATAGGLAFLHRAIRRGAGWSGNRLIGGMLIGWGSFNLVEGIVDHHILGIHHVNETVSNMLAWDLGFLAFGALLVIGGVVLSRRDRAQVETRRNVRRVA